MPRLPVFSRELQSFRAAIDKYREPGSYSPGKWSVSPLNRRSEIAGAIGRNRSAEEVGAEVSLIKSINPNCEVVYGGVRHRGDMEFAAQVGIDSVQF